jgi:hypothetical protein
VSRNRWHIERDDASVTVSRLLPARFDVSAETVLPTGARLRMAQQIRQDLWRLLQNARGFAPVVRVTTEDAGVRVIAGGAFTGMFPRQRIQDQIASLLEDPVLRARWSKCAALNTDVPLADQRAVSHD